MGWIARVEGLMRKMSGFWWEWILTIQSQLPTRAAGSVDAPLHRLFGFPSVTINT